MTLPRPRLGLWMVLTTGCFSEASDVEGGDTAPVTSSDSTAPGGTMPATSTVGDSTTDEPTTDEPTTDGGSSGTMPVDTGTVDSGDAETTQGSASSTGAALDCYSFDFDALSGGCNPQGVPLEFQFDNVLVAAANPDFATSGPCIATVDDVLTAPLTGGFLSMQLAANSAASLTFAQPVASVSFEFGPRHQPGEAASLAICTTTDGDCVETTNIANERASTQVSVPMQGAMSLLLFRTGGSSDIGIDALEVCFE